MLLFLLLIQDHSLEYGLSKGAKRDVSVEMTLGMKITGTEQAINFLRSSAPFFSFEKIHLRADGIGERAGGGKCRLQYDEGRIDGRYDDQDYEFDFSRAAPPGDLEKNKLKQLLWFIFWAGKEFTVTKQGEFHAEDKDQDATGEVMDHWFLSVLRMPEKPLRVGETWEKTFLTKREQKDNKGRFEVTQKSKLEKVVAGKAHLSSTMAGTLILPKDAPKDPNAEKSESSVDGKTSAVFDLKSGEIVSSESSGKVRFYWKGTGGDGEEMELEVVLSVDAKIAPR